MRRPVTYPTALLGVVALVAAVFRSPQVGDYVIDLARPAESRARDPGAR